MRVSSIYAAVTIASILSNSGLVSATKSASSTILESRTPQDIAPCSFHLRKVSTDDGTSQYSSLFSTGLEHLKAVARRVASISQIHLFDATQSDMGCYTKALRGDGSSAPFFLFESASSIKNQQQSAEDENGNPKSSGQLFNESQMQQVVEGARVAVYWPKYNKYYEAEVLQVDTAGKFYVEYMEDHYAEWVDAGRDTFRFVRGPLSSSSSQDDGSTWTQANMQDLLRSAKSIERIQNVGNDDGM